MPEIDDKNLAQSVAEVSSILEEIARSEPSEVQKKSVYIILRTSGFKAPLVVASKINRVSRARLRKVPRHKNGELNLRKIYESIE